MPPYNPNLATVVAGVPILEKGTYEFSVGDFKTFSGENEEGKANGGLRTSLKVESGDSFIGKTLPHSMYFHTEASWPMNKQFAMACLGYNQNQEEEFNEKYKDADFIVDPENDVVGQFWQNLRGARVAADVTVKSNDKAPSGKQNNFRWRPINA